MIKIKHINMKYKVRHYLDDEYIVVDSDNTTLFKGSLTDCEAWINLTIKGYLD